MLTGLVEPTHVNPFTFENQYRTFMRYGYADDPSVLGVNKGKVVGSPERVDNEEGELGFCLGPFCD